MCKVFHRVLLPIFSLAIVLAMVGVSNADIAYSNVTTFLGSAYAPGGAAGGITRMLIDDITPIATTPGDVTSISFAVYNGNATSQSVRARIRFWFADGAGGGPGTYYNVPANVGFTFNPFTFAPGVTTLTGTIGAGSFTMPQTKFWAGLTFDNVGTTTAATDTELNLFGMGIFDPPTVGSSADQFFQTTNPGSFFGTSNPPGALTNFGGTPVGNFGWEFVTTGVAVPEPSVLLAMLVGLAGCAMGTRSKLKS